MATIQRFEDIEAWQVARELTNKIYETTKGEAFSRDYGLKDQIQRAAVSIMSNIAEGFERDGNREFANFSALPKALPVKSAPSSTLRLIKNTLPHNNSIC